MPPRNTAWTQEEDEKLRSLVARHGCKKWTRIASNLPSKVGKQCRRRWQNYLNANLKTGVWTAEEDRILIEGHRLHGNKWTEIARMVTGRTDNAVKNRYMALIKKGSQEEDQDTSLSRDVSQCNTPTNQSAVTHAFPNSPKPSVCRPEPVRLPPNNSCRGASSDSSHSLEEKLKRSESSTDNSQDTGSRKIVDTLGTTTPELVARGAKEVSETSTSSAEVGMKVYPAKKRPDVGISIPSPTSTCPRSSFQEVGLPPSRDPAAKPPSAAPSPAPVVSTEDLRRQFDELLMQANCVSGGPAFVASTLATAQIALYSCRGAGPLAEMYLGSLAAMTRMSNFGMFAGPMSPMVPSPAATSQPAAPAAAPAALPSSCREPLDRLNPSAGCAAASSPTVKPPQA